MEQLSHRLDELIREIRLAPPSQQRHDSHVAQAEAIAGEIRTVFRGAAPTVNTPLRQDGNRAWW
ncbi:hypothetical protein [Sphingomonas ginkgonis]|uniref:hypothetical protein n=1 Tax=Sphingomonas ginkgonis TaxID=2315330 RepID=UPI000F85D488|nr:hypothetical protein [Sphingomonas ginkgonis]